MSDNFIKLIKIENNIFSYLNDFNITVEKIKNSHTQDVNIKFILHFKDSLQQEHYTNISEILTDKVLPSDILTIDDMILNYLDDMLVYSYETNFMRSLNQFVKLISTDWYDNFVFKGFNVETSNSSDVLSSPNFPDLSIDCSSDLNKKVVLSNNVLHKTSWKNDKAIINGDKEPFFKNQRMCFLNLSYSESVIIKNITEIESNNLISIPSDLINNYDFFICIKGHPIFLRKGIYYRASNSIVINWGYIHNLPMFREFSISELKNDINSYVCFVKCKKIYYRLTHLIDEGDIHKCYLPSPVDQNLSGYICYDTNNYQLFDMTIAKEKYKNPINYNEPYHGIYIEYRKDPNIIRKFQLLQILILK